MNSLTEAITRRMFDRNGDLARLPAAYRNAGRGGLMKRLAAAGLLRLALRWPGLSIVAILVLVVARVMSRHQQATIASGRQPDR